MTQSFSQRTLQRGRVLPEQTLSTADRTRKKAELQAFRQRCRPIFEKLRPELIENHYNWFIVIEPDSENYFIDQERMGALLKALEHYPNAVFYTFRLNETGLCGRV
ncbi:MULTISPECIES: hypothetical protein [unclassified Coleofasciculus]|uniref:hypothetical protein n=1 Tax=unclassified Coleofasciculus TaxID=2692782 RepID=UPI0018814914|nr:MULTISPECIES: hypothetical protein [unclassified Coleofasciculus]MBE9129584.1 hypothetical protein [Coleofasciculus sp. LEGE 07081]MBE9148264.1 hypothetical protein [Coleofasciculus sp. LEGE 07092]